MLNNVVLMGRLTRDPELRYSDYTKIAVATFSLAVERDYKDDSGEKKTDFIDIVTFRNTAEFVSKYFKKGQMACVVGRLQVSSYMVKDTGEKRRNYNINASSVYFADSKKSDAGQAATPQTLTDITDTFNDEDMPF